MARKAPSKINSSSPLGLEFMSIIEAAYDMARLSQKEALHINVTLDATIRDFIEENRHLKYKWEETTTDDVYPSTYKGSKPIEEQIKAVAEIFDLDLAQALEYARNLPALPEAEGAEGWIAVPSDEAITKLFRGISDKAERYCHMLILVNEKIRSSREFSNERGDEINTEHLRRLQRTSEKLAKVAETQPGDILVIPVQLGMLHRGRSARRAREYFNKKEFDLCPVMVGTIVLTHPERFTDDDELEPRCAGGEWSEKGDGDFDCVTIYNFWCHRVRFGAGKVDSYSQSYGSATGFVT